MFVEYRKIQFIMFVYFYKKIKFQKKQFIRGETIQNSLLF